MQQRPRWWWRAAVTVVLIVALVIVAPASPLRELLWIVLGTGIFVMVWDARRGRWRRSAP